MEAFYNLESQDGIRFSWNILPQNKNTLARVAVPLGCLYTPMKDLENLTAVQYKPQICRKCKAVLNPFCSIDFTSKNWTCVFCSTRNIFPKEYANQISEKNLPAELFRECSTMEYVLSTQPRPAPAFLFLIDLCVSNEELQAIKDSMLECIQLMPSDFCVGLITFNRTVFVHELFITDVQKLHAFRGDKEYQTLQIFEKLSLGGTHDPRGPQGLGAINNFIMPLSKCETFIKSIIMDLQPDPWPKPENERPLRATGTALSIGSSLLEALHREQCSRIITFIGGPCTFGPGQIVGAPYEETIRDFIDKEKKTDNFKYFNKAQKYYKTLAERASKARQVIDLYGFTLDQFGLCEMKLLPEYTGGYTIINELFDSKAFKENCKKAFEKDPEGEMRHGYHAEISVQCSKHLQISGCIGQCVSLKKTSSMVSEYEVGKGGTTAWYLGGIDCNSTLAFYLDIPNKEDDIFIQKTGHLQFVTQYRHPSGQSRMRVTTVSRKFMTTSYIKDLASGFDQEAAAVLIARQAVFRAEEDEPISVIRWLDKKLIRLATEFGSYHSSDPNSYNLPKDFALFPQFIYYLRRSNFIKTTACSIDESVYYRTALCRDNTTNSLVMIQPALLKYTLDNPQPQPVLLDIKSLQDDAVLLLDSFFHVVIWYGSTIHKWKEAGYQNDPEYAHFKKFLEIPLEDAKLIAEDRFPVPDIIQTHANHGQARFVKSRVNPSDYSAENTTCKSGDFISDDASLKEFIDQLVKFAVTPST